MFEVKILADSISELNQRLTTMEWTFPRCILAEINTHRMKSSNAASSRAIPTEKLIQRVMEDPFIPDFRLNQKGMQAGDLASELVDTDARLKWVEARDAAVSHARYLHGLNIHKQYVNRLLEPWMFCTIIISATDWDNIWKLRCHPDAEPSFQKIATMARDAMAANSPTLLHYGEWHTPLFYAEDWAELRAVEPNEETCVNIATRASAGRCARVSYLTHDGKRDYHADVALAYRLAESGHWSPFEHVARPFQFGEHSAFPTGYCGNFKGWVQLRKTYAGESGSNNPR